MTNRFDTRTFRADFRQSARKVNGVASLILCILVKRWSDEAIQAVLRWLRNIARLGHRCTRRVWLRILGVANPEYSPGSLSRLDGNENGVQIVAFPPGLASRLIHYQIEVVG